MLPAYLSSASMVFAWPFSNKKGGAAVAAPPSMTVTRCTSEPFFLKRQISTDSLASAPDALVPLTGASSSQDITSRLDHCPDATSSRLTDDSPAASVAAVAATAEDTRGVRGYGHLNYNQREDVGNLGVFLANWGRTSTDDSMQKTLDAMIKRSPCQILIMNEVDARTAEMLTASPRSLAQQPQVAHENAAVAAFFERSEYTWSVAKTKREHGTEAERGVGTIVAVKTKNTEEPPLDILFNECHFDGTFRKNGKNMEAYTHMIIVAPNLRHNTGHLGKKPVTMGVHFHYATAGYLPGLRAAHRDFWNKLARLIDRHRVVILAGDWNKSMMKVVPELRSRGVLIETAAWYPWCGGIRNTPHADSLAIFIVNVVVETKLVVGISMIGAAEPYAGFAQTLSSWPVTNGPGMLVDSYLPPTQDAGEKLKGFLERQFQTVEERSWSISYRRERKLKESGSTVVDPENPDCCLMAKEKRLMADLWSLNGKFYNGNHFPLCFFTSNPPRRSEEAYRKRKKQDSQRRRRKGKGNGAGSTVVDPAGSTVVDPARQPVRAAATGGQTDQTKQGYMTVHPTRQTVRGAATGGQTDQTKQESWWQGWQWSDQQPCWQGSQWSSQSWWERHA